MQDYTTIDDMLSGRDIVAGIADRALTKTAPDASATSFCP